MSPSSKIMQHIKNVCQNSGAKWGVLVIRTEGNWGITPYFGGNKHRMYNLNKLLLLPETSSWLAGAMSSGNPRSRQTGEFAISLDCHRIYAFPDDTRTAVILVGSDDMSKEKKDLFRLLTATGSLQQLDNHVESGFDFDILTSPQFITATRSSLPELVSASQRYLENAFGCESIVVYLLSNDKKTLIPPDPIINNDLTISATESLPGHVLQNRRIIRYSDMHLAPYAYQLNAEVRSGMYAPLALLGEPIGVIAMESTLPGAFTQVDESKLYKYSTQLSILFSNAILSEKSSNAINKLLLIHTVVQKVLSQRSENEISQETADLLARFLNCELAGIFLVDETNNYLIASGLGGSQSNLMVPGFQIPVSVGLTGKTFRTGVPGVYNDLDQVEEYFSYPGWRAGSEMCVPLRDAERIIGLINVEAVRKNAFSEFDLHTLESLSGIISSVLINLRRYRELNQRIDAQQLAENRLVRSARLAAVGEMAAGVAHELNNPLTTIIGFLELVLEDLPESAGNRSDLEIVLHEAQRAREVVRRLLDFSRQSGNINIRVDINDLVREVIPLVQHQFQTSGVEVISELAGGLPYININPSQIKQVILNLLQNALQAMGQGGELRIKTGLEVREDGMGVFIQVCDTGEGIPPENFERIFEPFFTTRPVGKGTGLGLSVSYGIVTSHGGHIDIESKVGLGSCFTVWLPLESRRA